MFAIVVNEKGGEQKRLEFDKPEVTIGRVQGNDIILPKGNVSKRHSRIVLKDGKFIIVDLKSTNGTYVNGRKITSPLVVKGSDKIYIGDFILSIEEAQGGAQVSDDVAPPPPPPRKAPSLPAMPTSSRRPTQPQEDFEGPGDGVSDDAPPPPDEPEATPPPPPEPRMPEPRMQEPRMSRPSAPAMAPAPLPPPAPRSPSGQSPRMDAPRPSASRPDMPTMQPTAAPRPAPVPAPQPMTRPSSGTNFPSPAAAPQVAPVRRPSAQQPARKPAAVDDSMRQKVSEAMRELSARLLANLGLTGNEPNADEELWRRAESAAGDLVEQLAGEGALPAGADHEALAKDVVAETLGLGPLDDLIADEQVREVSAGRHDRIYVDRGGAMALAPKWFSSPEALVHAVERLMARAGRSSEVAAARTLGFLEARVAEGLVLTATLPPLAARGASLALRRPHKNAQRLADLVTSGLLTRGQADTLEAAVRARKNIAVSGPAASGRSALLTGLARVAEGERLVSVEEGEELDLGEGPWTALIGRGPHARTALSAALRLKPERLIVGDVRGAEALDLVGALASGTTGAAFSVTAASPREALLRLDALARLAPEAPARGVADEIARGVQVVVQLARAGDGTGDAHVTEIVDVQPGEGGAQLREAR